MKRNLVLLFAFYFIIPASASVFIPDSNPYTPAIEKRIPDPVLLIVSVSTLNFKQVETLIGRKLKWKEKIGLQVFKWTHKKKFGRQQSEYSNKGKTALLLGIIGICSLVIPVAGIISLPLAILAIIFGNQALKINPGDRKAKTGLILGWITIGLIILAIALLIAILSSGAFWWG
jgi:hypothetical protein